MTEEEIAALKAEAESAKKAAEEASKALTEKEAKISDLNSALHEERSKNKGSKEKEVIAPALDEEKVKQVAERTASELLYKNEISKFLKEVSNDDDERKLIEARFEAMRGSETDPQKLKDIILDAKFVTERRKGGRANASSLGSSAGGRDIGYGSDDREDNGKARKMGENLFGIDPKKADELSKPIDLRN